MGTEPTGVQPLSKPLATALAAGLALCAAFAAEPASALPVAGSPSLAAAAPSAVVQDVYYRRRFFYRRTFVYRRPFVYRRYGYGYGPYGYRRGLPVYPIRRFLRVF